MPTIHIDCAGAATHDNQNVLSDYHDDGRAGTILTAGNVIDDTGAVVPGVAIEITSRFAAQVSGQGAASAEINDVTEDTCLYTSSTYSPSVITVSGLAEGDYTVTTYGLRDSTSDRRANISVNGGANVLYNARSDGTHAERTTTHNVTIAAGEDVTIAQALEVAEINGLSWVGIQWTEEADTTAPVFTVAPAAEDATTTGHNIAATINESGTIYAVRMANGATAPTSAEVKAGVISGDLLEAKSVSAAAGIEASMTFSTGSLNTAYDYYSVAEDDEATPNLQAAPVLAEATTLLTDPVFINDVDGDNVITEGQAGVEVNGGNFGAAQLSGSAVTDGGVQVPLVWVDGLITFNHVLGNSKYGQQTVTVTNDGGSSDSIAITVNTIASASFQDIASPGTGDGYIESVGPLVTGDQVKYVNVTSPSGYSVTINADASFSIDGPPEGETFNARAFDSVDETWGSWATQSAEVPTNSTPTGQPAISGTAQEGETLTASAGTLADADGISSIAYQWLRGGVEISGAAGVTYLLVSADVGNTITVEATITDNDAVVESAITSAATSSVTAAPTNSVPTGQPAITGTAQEGQTLTASIGTLADSDGIASIAYQWLRDGVEIAGATYSTYLLVLADVGSVVTVEAVITDNNSVVESAISSAATSIVIAEDVINSTPTGRPVISGTAQDGWALTASSGTLADADGIASIDYQWLRDGAAISGAINSTYMLVSADVGSAITVEATITDNSSVVEDAIASAATPIVVAADTSAQTLGGIVNTTSQILIGGGMSRSFERFGEQVIRVQESAAIAAGAFSSGAQVDFNKKSRGNLDGAQGAEVEIDVTVFSSAATCEVYEEAIQHDGGGYCQPSLKGSVSISGTGKRVVRIYDLSEKGKITLRAAEAGFTASATMRGTYFAAG